MALAVGLVSNGGSGGDNNHAVRGLWGRSISMSYVSQFMSCINRRVPLLMQHLLVSVGHRADEMDLFFAPLSSYWRAKQKGGIFLKVSKLSRDGGQEVTFTASELMEILESLAAEKMEGLGEKKRKK